jgi:Tol biopolymer transport system component
MDRRTRMTWKRRDGTILEDLHVTDAVAAIPSTDGRLIMMARHSHQMNTIAHVIVDPSRGTVTPFSSPDTTSTSTVWSPDDRRVVYSLLRDGAFDLYIKDIKAGGSEQRLLHTDGMKAAQSWSPDGKVILFNAVSAETRLDLWAIDAVPGATPRIVVGGEADQCCGRFSPNGEWIAYVSNESGRAEVFVRPTKGEAEPIRISSNGGGAPEWRSSGGELYFINPENRVMSVPVKVSAGHLTASAPSPLFQITSRLKPAVRLLASDDRPYATVGDRFLITENEVDPRGSTINLLLNWSAPARQ